MVRECRGENYHCNSKQHREHSGIDKSGETDDLLVRREQKEKKGEKIG
jgi:hypothetical protein